MRRLLGTVLALAPLLAVEVAAQDAGVDTLGQTLGSPDAAVTVVEFADFACSACAEFATLTWPAVREEFVETGRVRWILVPFDFGFRNSDEGSRAAACALEHDRFWPMHDALFLERDRWVGERNPEDELAEIAVGVGIPEEAFRECYDADRDKARREAATEAARDAGLRGTPTFFIDGQMVQGALPLEAFRALIGGARKH